MSRSTHEPKPAPEPGLLPGPVNDDYAPGASGRMGSKCLCDNVVPGADTDPSTLLPCARPLGPPCYAVQDTYSWTDNGDFYNALRLWRGDS